MTTCVWDGEWLCSDTRSMTGSVIDQTPCQKIFTRNGVYCAISGDLAEVTVAVKKLLNPKKHFVDDPSIDEGDWQIILVSATREEYYCGSLLPSPAGAPFAIGTGGSYALAAMLAGKTGAQAVRLACRMDALSGIEFGVRKYRVRPKHKAKRSTS